MTGSRTGRASLDVSGAGPADRPAWESFVAAHPAADQLQDWAWGEVADVGGERPVRLVGRDAAGEIAAVAQLLVRPTSFGRTVAYAPHGPLWAATTLLSADEALDGILAGIRDRAVRERAIVAKIDPRAPLPSATSGASASGSMAAGPTYPWPEGPAVAAALVGRGLRPALDLQARTTRLVDLRPGTDAVLASFEKDTRNLIRRSEREGVRTRVVRDDDEAAYATFARLLAETGARAAFRTRGERELASLAKAFAPARRSYLVLADLGGREIAGCLAVRLADRAFYLYAGSVRDRELRHANGAYAALWALCRTLAEDGVAWLDLWGVTEADDATADPAWAGFSLFKRGFGGTPLRHPGTFDLVISTFWYRVRDLRERRLLRRAR